MSEDPSKINALARRFENAPRLQGLSNLAPQSIENLLDIAFMDDWTIFVEDVKQGNFFFMSAHTAQALPISEVRKDRASVASYSLKMVKDSANRRHILVLLSRTVPIAAIAGEAVIKEVLGNKYKEPRASAPVEGITSLSEEYAKALWRFWLQTRMDGREMAGEQWQDGTIHLTISPPEKS